MMECLDKIVGVTTSDCTCIVNGLDANQIAALRVSKSGLYLDDLPGGVHLKALQHVDACRKMSEMAFTAIKNARKATEDDLIIALNGRYKKAKKNFVGQIGRMSFAISLAANRRWQGLRIQPVDVSDGVLTVTAVTMIINESGNFNIHVLKVPSGSVMGEEIETIPIAAVANSYVKVQLTQALNLFFSDDIDSFEYWFLWDRNETTGTALPKDTKIECSTCPKAGGNSMSEFALIRGVQLDDLNSLQTAISDAYTHGLILDASIKCDTDRLVCREYDEEEASAVALANAVWYKAGQLLIEEVQKQTDVSRYTTMRSEYLWGKRDHFRKEYDIRINYLAASIDVNPSNCYVCREIENQPFIGKIVV